MVDLREPLDLGVEVDGVVQLHGRILPGSASSARVVDESPPGRPRGKTLRLLGFTSEQLHSPRSTPKDKLTPEQVKAVESLLDYCLSLGCEVTWGTGSQRGSFNVKEPLICPRSILTCYSSGDLTFNLFWLHGSEIALHAQHRLRELAGKKLNLPTGKEDRPLAIDQWFPRSREVAEVVHEVLADCRDLAKVVTPDQ